jgi:hypothetical protein
MALPADAWPVRCSSEIRARRREVSARADDHVRQLLATAAMHAQLQVVAGVV